MSNKYFHVILFLSIFLSFDGNAQRPLILSGYVPQPVEDRQTLENIFITSRTDGAVEVKIISTTDRAPASVLTGPGNAYKLKRKQIRKIIVTAP